jgi:hypothetical protein
MNSEDRSGNTVFRRPKKSVRISNTSNEAEFGFKNVPKAITRKGNVPTWRTNQNMRGLAPLWPNNNTRRKFVNLNTSATNKQTRNASSKNNWRSGLLTRHISHGVSLNNSIARAQRRAKKEKNLYGNMFPKKSGKN